MKAVILSIIALMFLSGTALAGRNYWDLDNSRPYKDSWGNSYEKSENLYKDTDKDGVANIYDYNDKNPRIQNPYQQDYSRPKTYDYNYTPKNYRRW